VRFDLQVRFSSLPQGCFTDNLGDTICYAQLSEQIKRICQLQEYQLIEKLGWDAFAAVKEILPQDTKLWLRLVKEKPPVENLEGGSSFTLADWAE
jgi:dihydroneopterin aldolase